MALFILPQDDSGSYASSCKLLGINQQGNYTARGLNNVAAYDKYLQLTGDIVTGDMALCRYFFGKLTSESKQSITITLEPIYTFGIDKYVTTCTPRKRARMERWEPSLDDYEREEI